MVDAWDEEGGGYGDEERMVIDTWDGEGAGIGGKAVEEVSEEAKRGEDKEGGQEGKHESGRREWDKGRGDDWLGEAKDGDGSGEAGGVGGAEDGPLRRVRDGVVEKSGAAIVGRVQATENARGPVTR